MLDEHCKPFKSNASCQTPAQAHVMSSDLVYGDDFTALMQTQEVTDGPKQ